MTGLSEDRQRLLAQRLVTKTGRRPAPAPIPPRPPGPVPLSTGQTALLYEHQLRPDRAAYNVVHAYHLRGPLELDRLERAILSAALRHEPLWTSFGPERDRLSPSEAVQVVEVAADDAGFEDLAKQEATRRFDLERGPLLRATLAQLDAEHVGLVLAVHHVSSDAASLRQLWGDIAAAYDGHPFEPLPVSYSDHAMWQAGRVTDDDHAFWQQHLGPDPRPVGLPFATPVTPEPDGYRTMALDVSHDALVQAGLRPVAFFLGLFAHLLQRYVDGDEVVVGVAASTRDHPSIEQLVGYFLNVLPLRVAVEPHASVTALTRATDATLAAGLARRHVPYAELTALLRQRGAAEAHLARVMFVFDEVHQPIIGGCRVDGSLVHNECAVTDLTLFARRRGAHYEVSVEWDGSRYAAADIARLVQDYAALATWALSHPATPLVRSPAEADLVGPPLRHELQPLPSLIAARCLERPDATALRCGPDRLTYRELHQRVAAAAAGLAAHGVGPGDRVAVALRRSVDLVTTALAVQWLGAGYVPVDASYPERRVRLILAAAEPRLVVTDVAGQWAGTDPGIPTVTPPQLLAGGVEPRRTPAATLDDPAYVIFTSGSTGIPRGVVVDQRRLAWSTLARLDHYDEPVGRFLLVSSFGFDSSVVGLFWTLVTGGEIVLPTDEEVHDVDALGALAEQAAVTHLLMVPALYQALLRRAGPRLATLRCAIVAGEACPPALVAGHHDWSAETALWNEYGPTEATVWATAHRCRPGDDPVPIGIAVPGVVLRVADRWLRPRPSGAAGELVIGGAGVCDGYLAAGDAGSGSFVEDPEGGRRWYRTGDVVRRRADGSLLFLGRSDHQLSVGGIRIEPEEIEAALLDAGATAALVRTERQLDHDVLAALGAMTPDLQAELLGAAASSGAPARALADLLARHAPGKDALVAYVEGDGLDRQALLAGLRHRLPAAVVPTAVEVVAALARTEHGKIDRAALPPPLRIRPAGPSGDDHRHALGAFVDAWRAVLGDRTVGPDSDFFDAGGDSLRAVELADRLETALGQRVPISTLVLGRTPRRLASLLGAPTREPAPAHTARRSHVVPLRTRGDRPPLVILPPGGGNLIVYDPFVQAFDARFPVLGFDLPGFERDDDLPASVESLCDTYLPQLREAQPHGPYRFLGWSFGGVVALELAQRLVAAGETVDLIAMIDTLVPGLQRVGRVQAYVELARGGDLPGVARKLVQTVQVRLMLQLARRRGRRAAKTGTTLPPADRNTWLTIKVDEIVERYRAQPYDGRVVFFSAQNTYAWRTTEPWRRLMPLLEVVPIEGTHEGDEGLLSGARAERIAREVAARLT